MTTNEQLFDLCDCDNCPLQKRRGPVFGDGNFDADFAIVAEAPATNEVVEGRPMVGPSGQMSDDILTQVGSDRSNVYVTNTVLCRSNNAYGKEEPPPPKAIKCCSLRLTEELRMLHTDVVVAAGATATKSLMRKSGRMADVVGSTVWNDTLQKWIIPTYHTAHVLHGNAAGAVDIADAYRRAHDYAQGRTTFTNDPKIPYTYCTTTSEVGRALRQIERKLTTPYKFALDTETEYAGDPTYTLLLVQISDGVDTWVLEQEALAPHRDWFARILADPNGTWIFHNAAFDFQYLHHNYGITPPNFEDTMALALCLTEKGEQVGLKKLSHRYLNAPTYETAFNSYPEPSAKNPVSNIPRKDLVPYAAYDAYYTYHLLEVMLEMVDEEGNYALYEDVLRNAQRTFSELGYTGVLVDREQLDDARAEWIPKLDAIRAELEHFAEGYDFDARTVVKKPKSIKFNPNSPVQVKHLLYDLMKYKKVFLDRKVTTGEKFYEANPDAPVTLKLKEHSRISKMISTYIDGVVDDIQFDGRVHPSYKLFGAVTGRISCSDPPIQTIPTDLKLGTSFPSLRKMYIAIGDHYFVEVDYTTLEVYIAYHYSHDVAMGAALATGDFHTKAASLMYEIALEIVTRAQRQDSKELTYGVMYRLQAKALMEKLGGTLQDNQTFIDNWFAGFPEYFAWWTNQQIQALETREMRTATGRVRRWEFIDESNEDHVRNQAVNFPIQSLANDLCLMSLNSISKALPHDYGRAITTVHDSIEFEIKKQHLDRALDIIVPLMTTPQFETPVDMFPVEVKIGQNWSELSVYER